MGYAGQAVNVNEYKGLEFCDASTDTSGECLYETGEDLIIIRGLQDIDIWQYLAFLRCGQPIPFGLAIANFQIASPVN